MSRGGALPRCARRRRRGRSCTQRSGNRQGVMTLPLPWQVWGGGCQGCGRWRRRGGLLRLWRLFAIRRHLRDLFRRTGRRRRRAPAPGGAPAGRRSQIRLGDRLHDCCLWGRGEDPHLAFGDLRYVHGKRAAAAATRCPQHARVCSPAVRPGGGQRACVRGHTGATAVCAWRHVRASIPAFALLRMCFLCVKCVSLSAQVCVSLCPSVCDPPPSARQFGGA